MIGRRSLDRQPRVHHSTGERKKERERERENQWPTKTDWLRLRSTRYILGIVLVLLVVR